MTTISRRAFIALPAVPALGLLNVHPASAQSRSETLRFVVANSLNGLDPATFGVAREVPPLSMAIYDRLLSFDTHIVDGVSTFNGNSLRGELAERWEVSPDGLKIIFHLRRDALFHDGSPVTAEDVKWSLDRAVTLRGLAAPQLASGSLTKPEQFRVVDAHTFEVTLPKPDRLATGNLAHPFSRVINSKLAKQHATAEDPWAAGWLKENAAGSGAYSVEKFVNGQHITMRRNEQWKCGPGGKLPFFRRIIAQTVPEAATRANLVERGDADLCIDLQISDVMAIERRRSVQVLSIPQSNTFTFIALNNRAAPFNDIRLRQAVAKALPYDDLFAAAVHRRGQPLYGASWGDTPPDGSFPQAVRSKQDLEGAKKLLAEAGHANGFATTISFGLTNAAVHEPIAALVKQALEGVGIKAEIQKLPEAQLTSGVLESRLGITIETAGAALSSTDYFFRIFFQGDARWNVSRWSNAEIIKLVEAARFERDPAAYSKMTQRMVQLLADEVPLIPLWKPNQEAVMASSLRGYTYWFHRQPDVRNLSRA